MEECSVVRNKRIKPQHNEDRISALPDPVHEHILSLLPSTREAVRTSILSKRWQYQWTRVLVLIFKQPDKRFIENVLMLHDCPKIKELHLKYDFHSDPRFASKIRFAIRKSVEQLSLSWYDDESYLLPKLLFDCASLVRLKMAACHFMSNWAVNRPSLKSLKIDCRVLSLDNDRSQGITNVVSGSPMLESLEFRGTMGDRDAIVSKSLKKLSFVDVKIPTGVKILCPNLEELHVLTDLWLGSTFPDQMIENVLLFILWN